MHYKNKGINNLNYSKMDTKKYYEYAAIFSERDVKDSFVKCAASVMDECDDVAILVESQNGISRIASITNTYEDKFPKLKIHENVAGQYGIDAEATEILLNIAAIIKDNTRLSIAESVDIVTAITENYDISHR